MYNKCGDADVKAGRTKNTDPEFNFYSGIPFMINNNKLIEEKRGSVTKYVGLSVNMKRDCIIDCKTWDGKLVHTVSSLDVEYMLYETIPENKN